MIRATIFVAIICWCFSFVAHAQGRVWTDASGNKIEATFVRVKEDTLFLRKGTLGIPVPLSNLSIEDRNFLRDYLMKRGKTEDTLPLSLQDIPEPSEVAPPQNSNVPVAGKGPMTIREIPPVLSAEEIAEAINAAEIREWRPTHDETIKARFVRLRDAVFTIQTEDGKYHQLDRSMWSKESLLKSAFNEQAEIPTGFTRLEWRVWQLYLFKESSFLKNEGFEIRRPGEESIYLPLPPRKWSLRLGNDDDWIAHTWDLNNGTMIFRRPGFSSGGGSHFAHEDWHYLLQYVRSFGVQLPRKDFLICSRKWNIRGNIVSGKLQKIEGNMITINRGAKGMTSSLENFSPDDQLLIRHVALATGNPDPARGTTD